MITEQTNSAKKSILKLIANSMSAYKIKIPLPFDNDIKIQVKKGQFMYLLKFFQRDKSTQILLEIKVKWWYNIMKNFFGGYYVRTTDEA